MSSNNVFNCPHCQEFIIVNKIKCGIFRHGFYVKKNKKGQIIEILNQIKPHLNQVQCQKLKKQSNVIGCCKPFRIIKDEITNEITIESCDFDE